MLHLDSRSTLILVSMTYPYPDPDTCVERVQPQIFQLKFNLKAATDGHDNPQKDMSNRHAGYFASSYVHDEKVLGRRVGR